MWFDKQAQEAAEFYISIFKNSRITYSNPMMVSFNLDGQEVMALNGGPEFKFTEAMSMYVNCQDQEEVDYFWNKLTEGGSEGQCGWLKDKYGLSWQIIPNKLGEFLGDQDQTKSARVMQAMLKMKKIIVGDLEKAYAEDNH